MPIPRDASQVTSAQNAARAQFDKLSAAYTQLKATQGELQSLAGKGATLEVDDIVDSGERLLSFGADPARLASQLADLPEGGPEALQGWVGQMQEQNNAQEQQIVPMLAAARHELAVSALHSLVHESMPKGGTPPTPDDGQPMPATPDGPAAMGVQ